MGKAKKSKSSKIEASKHVKNVPLSEQILEDKSVRSSGRAKQRNRKDTDEEVNSKKLLVYAKLFVGDKLSKKILEQAKQQQQELEEEHGWTKPAQSKDRLKGRILDSGARQLAESDEDESSDDSETEEHFEPVEVDDEDEKALENFMSHNRVTQRTLADIIQEKLTEKQTEIHTQLSDNASVQMQQLDDRVVNMYRSIRDILAKYRSGKLPKAFKIIPSLANWEQILFLTEPDRWSAAAMYQATRIFASNLNAQMAQRFFNLVLLPRIRDDITEYKRLNFHLYMALQKALFKPAGFFKGVLLPLCECGTCTLREAIIVSSVLAKNSIPILHSAAAMLKIAEMEYNGANSIFLRTLLDKKYALPYRVVDSMVHHFIKFQSDKRVLPVLWHQCLLTFVQRYKADVSSEQKQALLELLRVHTHEQITLEVRRELVNSKCRDEEVPVESAMDDD